MSQLAVENELVNVYPGTQLVELLTPNWPYHPTSDSVWPRCPEIDVLREETRRLYSNLDWEATQKELRLVNFQKSLVYKENGGVHPNNYLQPGPQHLKALYREMKDRQEWLEKNSKFLIRRQQQEDIVLVKSIEARKAREEEELRMNSLSTLTNEELQSKIEEYLSAKLSWDRRDSATPNEWDRLEEKRKTSEYVKKFLNERGES